MRKLIIIIVICLLFVIPSYIFSYAQAQILSGIVVVLDSGHGGFDKGASVGEVDEAPLNLMIVKKLEKRLVDLGCEVILTRTNENDLSSSDFNRKKEDMNKRIEMINKERNDLLISIHMNKFQDESVKGLHVFYAPNSKELAQIIQNEVNMSLNQNKQIKQGDFFLLNHSKITSVLIECGFLSNIDDRNNILDENYQNKLVDCIVNGIIEYYTQFNYI